LVGFDIEQAGVLIFILARKAFNETDGIFQAATIDLIVVFIAVALERFANQVRTHPDVSVYVLTITTLIDVQTAVWFIILPKIRRVLSGEKVVISNLMAPDTVNGGMHRPSAHPLPDAEKETIVLTRKEPIPGELEQDLLGVNKLIRGVKNELYVFLHLHGLVLCSLDLTSVFVITL
jgi:hypothetical protein